MNKETWVDLYDRLKNAENELEELADATNDPSEASRLMSKMHGVSLARDYMRGYFDPSSEVAAAPSAPRGGIPYPDPATHTKTVWKFIINPFTKTEMPRGSEILYVGEQGNDVCVWALVDPSVAANEERSIDAYGTGHTVPTNPGRYLGSVQMTNGHNAGLVFHLFDGDDV